MADTCEATGNGTCRCSNPGCKRTRRPTFEEFIKNAEKRFLASEGQIRRGQAYFSELQDIRPLIAEMLRGGWCDPYYRDDLLETFLAVLQTCWGSPTFIPGGES